MDTHLQIESLEKPSELSQLDNGEDNVNTKNDSTLSEISIEIISDSSTSQNTSLLPEEVTGMENIESADQIATTSQNEIQVKDSVENTSEINITKRIAQKGVAFLLSQIVKSNIQNHINEAGHKRIHDESRVSKTTNEISTKLNPNIFEKINEETIAKRPRIEMVYKFFDQTLDEDKKPLELLLEPMIKYRDCFNSGTAPNFRFSKQIKENNYVRSCSWSSSGDWLITDSEDRIARIFSYNDNKLEHYNAVKAGDLIYDIAWHPTDDIFASTSKDQPIHLIKPNGERVLTFRGINDLDELSAAQSLSFSLDGKTLYAGYYKVIRIFDMQSPGRQVHSIATFEKGCIGGQKSIISCIAQNPIFPGLYAAASYGYSIGFYSDQTGVLDSLINASSPGITHIQYSHDGNFLYCGCRRSNIIEVFDLRFPGQVLANLERAADTNQRIYFQIDKSDRYLFSGSSDGRILVHDLSDMGQFLDAKKPSYSIPISNAVVAGLNLHPTVSSIAVTTGQRVFPKPIVSESDSDDSDDGKYVYLRNSQFLDNSLQLFDL